jgi:membrane protease YdiL (CAAX protease family)
MKTRVIQDEPDRQAPATPAARGPEVRSSGLVLLMRRHRLAAFFVIAYAVSWWPWPLYAAGVFPEPMFVPAGPLVAALIVLSVTEGKAGLRDLGARMIRWRVGWRWYAVALGFPLAVILITAEINAGFGAPAPEWSQLAWSTFALTFAINVINPMNGPMGEEPGWRGYAVPRLQTTRSRLVTASILGLFVTGWHFPLVAMGDLHYIGLPATFAITIVYVWLFNHARGSVLLPLLFHATQGALTMDDFNFTGADVTRMNWLGAAAWCVVAIGVVVLDRRAWRDRVS